MTLGIGFWELLILGLVLVLIPLPAYLLPFVGLYAYAFTLPDAPREPVGQPPAA